MSFEPDETTGQLPEVHSDNVIQRYRPKYRLERFGPSASRSAFPKANYLRKQKSLKNRSKTVKKPLRFGYHRSDILR